MPGLTADPVFLDLLNPSGQSCNSALTCSNQLVFSDGSPLVADAAWDAVITFDVQAGTTCFKITEDARFAGRNCHNFTRVLCKYDCYNRKCACLPSESSCRNRVMRVDTALAFGTHASATL